MANDRLRFKLDGIAFAYLVAFVVVGLLLFMWLFPLVLPQAVTLAIAGLAVGVLGWLVFMVSQQSAASSSTTTKAASLPYQSTSPAAPVAAAPAAPVATSPVRTANPAASAPATTPPAAVVPAPAAPVTSRPPAAAIPAMRPASAAPRGVESAVTPVTAPSKAGSGEAIAPKAAAAKTVAAKKPAAPKAPAGKPASATAAATGQKTLFDAPAGPADDLKLISGVGPVLEKNMNAIGITTFAQVAKLTAEQTAEVEGHLGFRGRIERDEWVKQAEVLARGGAAEYERVFGKKPR